MSVRDHGGDDVFDVLDVHQHVGSLRVLTSDFSGSEPAPSRVIDPADAPERIAVMDRFGIDQACVMPPPAWPRPITTAAVNDAVASYREANPNRFPAAVGAVDVWAGEDGLEEIRRAVEDLRLDGLVWHHAVQGAYVNHPSMREALRFCAAHEVPAFIHVMAESTMEAPWRLEELAEQFPDVQFVALAGFSSTNQAAWVTRVARLHPNVVCDLGAMSTVVGSFIERFVDEVGDDRLLLGTDMYVGPKTFSFPAPVFEVLHSSLSGESKRKILGGNARRILGLQPRPDEDAGT